MFNESYIYEESTIIFNEEDKIALSKIVKDAEAKFNTSIKYEIVNDEEIVLETTNEIKKYIIGTLAENQLDRKLIEKGIIIP